MSFWRSKITEKEEKELKIAGSEPKESSPNTDVKQNAPVSAEPITSSDQRSLASNIAEDNFSSKYGKIRSALGTGSVIQGKLSFDTPVSIDGKLSGEIFSSKALIVGEKALVEAQINVACLVVMGKVKGNITATERVEITATGSVEGKVFAPILVVEPGGILNAEFRMTKKNTEIFEALESKDKQANKDKNISTPYSEQVQLGLQG